jgi:hypothetical protein
MTDSTNPKSSVSVKPDKKTRERSPNYPAFGLRRALELAQKLWESDKRQSVLATRAAVNMGFTAKSSAGLLALAAMKKYGLLDDEGSGDSRKMKLSDAAITLLNPSSQNREQLLKQAALRPSIHAELWNKYGTDGASAGAIHDYLVFDRKFTEQASKILIEQYTDTISFANLVATDKVNVTEDDFAEHEKPVEQPLLQQQKPPNNPPNAGITPPKPPMTPNLRYLPIPLDIGDAPIPIGMSEDDYHLLLDTLKLWKKKIVRAVIPEFPKKAIWRNKDHDAPVTIVGIAGEKDGVMFYKSETGTGIPAAELDFNAPG